MHNSIYKYQLHLVTIQVLQIPKSGQILSAQIQRDNICIWASVDTSEKSEDRTIGLVETGAPFPKINPDQEMVHIETVQLYGITWHVFEIIQKGKI